MIRNIVFLFKHEVRLEFRQKETLASIFLFVLASCYVVFQAVKEVDHIKSWNALLWIVLLFGAFQAIGKSFLQNQKGLRLYLFTTVQPTHFIIAKLMYNVLFMMVLGLVGFTVHRIFLGADLLDGIRLGRYLVAVISGAIGFAGLLTLISAIAGQSDGSSGLTSILGLPVSIPLILIIMNLTTSLFTGQAQVEFLINLGYLWIMNLGLMGLTILLFPYLWTD
ncbi:MAG: hypothetical protein HRT74_14455 [Flavobacteriales bacterium]|nr:hypothetical protein [Flavobacteriales bacterium]